MRLTPLLPLVSALLLSACASNQPVLYTSPAGADPNAGAAAVAECSRLAEQAGASNYGGQVGQTATDTARNAAAGAAAGAVGGAIAGNVAQGAGIGAAGAAAATLVQRIFAPPAPNSAYRAYVERCLRDKGYETVGWK